MHRIRITKSQIQFFDQNGTHSCEVKNGISAAVTLRDFLSQNTALTKDYKECTVELDTPTIIVPAEEISNFANKDLRQKCINSLYFMSMNSDDTDHILSVEMPQLQTVALFPINAFLKNELEEKISECRFEYSHICIPVWNKYLKVSQQSKHQQLFVYLHDKTMDVFSFKHNRFRFANSYDLTNADDCTFILMSVWRQLALSQTRDECILIDEDKDAKEPASANSRMIAEIKEKLSMFISKITVE